jgi:NitT/TauT family transport system permease protein
MIDMLPVKKSTAIRTVLLAALVAAIEVICRFGLVSQNTLISPSEMATALIAILRSGRFNDQIWSTISNVGAAIVLSVVLGIIAGVVLHAIPRVRQAVQPFLASCYAIPGFIFYVPLLGVFGLNDIPLISIGFILAAPSMILATLNGLDRIPPVFLRVSRLCQTGDLAAVFLVKLPCAAPYLFSGVRLCVAYAFIGVLASEFILSDRGVGYSIAFAYNDFDTRTMYALMLLIILLVTGANMALQAWENRLMVRRRR